MDKPKLASPQQALSRYLQSMLAEPQPEASPPQPLANLLAQIPPILTETGPQELPPQPVVPVKPEQAVIAQPKAPVLEPPVVVAELKPPVTVQPDRPSSPPPPPVNAEGVPLWAESGFQSLFFEVAGLKLAVPLIKLGGIHAITEVTSLPRKPDWFKGLMRIDTGETLRVVDSALWVMPEKYQQLTDRLEYQYLIRLEHSPWALACTRVLEAVSIDPAQVKWRQSAGKRPWMSGLLVEQMCALLEVDALIALLGD